MKISKPSEDLFNAVARAGADAIRVRDNINYTVGSSNLALCILNLFIVELF